MPLRINQLPDPSLCFDLFNASREAAPHNIELRTSLPAAKKAAREAHKYHGYVSTVNFFLA
jgi:hypothetical protein